MARLYTWGIDMISLQIKMAVIIVKIVHTNAMIKF